MRLKVLASVFFSFIFAFWPLAVAQADTPGLTVEVYTYDPLNLPDRVPYTLCATDTVWTSANNIFVDWDGQFQGIVGGCQGDFVLMHYSGFITAPVTGQVTFQSLADDGFWLSLDGVTVIDNWMLKGCSGGQGTFDMVAGQSYALDSWFYEYGGGACNELYWDLNDSNGLVPVPDSAFSQNPLPVVIPEPPVIPVDPPVIDPDPPVIPVDPPVIPVDPPVIPKPPVIDPQPPVTPIPDPVPTADPTPTPEPSSEPVTPVLSPAEEHQAVLDGLMQQAQADDIQVPEQIANIPVFGASVVALTNAVNFIGNVGADMSPSVRHKAKQEIVAAVVVTQVAQFSTQSAISSAQASVSGGSRVRKNK
jgi:hypothetical protein